jgi:hypothetical protein
MPGSSGIIALERSSPSPASSQGPLTHIMCPLSGGYCDSDQEIRDLQLTHATRSEMAAGELLDRDSVERQVEQYLQSIEDNVMECVEVALPGACRMTRGDLNELALGPVLVRGRRQWSGLVGLPYTLNIKSLES